MRPTYEEMSSHLFVVSGAPHAGLEYLSRVLTALGAPCGHEDVFHTAAFERSGTLFWPPNCAGDASWFAAPVLGKLPPGSVVVHQVRNPLDTISDLLDSEFFDRDTPSRAFVQDFLPETRLGGPMVRCMRLWLQWNRMVEAAGDLDDLVYRRHRLEDFDGRLASETLALFGVLRNAATSRAVLDSLGPPPRAAGEPLSWSDLPSGKLRGDLKAAARAYGYEVTSVRARGA